MSANVFPIPVDTAFTLMFTQSKFFKRSLNDLGITGLQYTPWTLEHDRTQSRCVKYQVPVNQPLFKVVHTTETQSLLKASANEGYKILVSAVNADIPFSDTFRVDSLYCLTRGDSDSETIITVHATVVFCGSGWSFKMMKPIIEKQAYDGVTNHVGNLIDALIRYCTRRPSIIGEIIDAEKRSVSGNSLKSSSPYLNRIRIEEPNDSHRSNSVFLSRETLLTSLSHANDSTLR